MAHKFAILFTTLLVLIAAHDSLYSSKIHVMAQDGVLHMAAKLFQYDPTCETPCNTHSDCVRGWLCQACWNSKKTCNPYVTDALTMGL
ncbi:unnamed protein product [Withania somnifera]